MFGSQPEATGHLHAVTQQLRQTDEAHSRALDGRAFRTALVASVAVLLVLGLAFLLYTAWGIVKPLIVAIVIATTLWPSVSKIAGLRIGPRRWRLPRVAAAALVYIATLLIASLLAWGAVTEAIPRVLHLLDAYPTQTAAVREYVEPFRAGNIADGAGRVAAEVASGASETQTPRPNDDAPTPAVRPGTLLIGFFGGLFTLGLVLVFTFFLLIDGARFAQWSMALLPRGRRSWARRLGLEIRDRVGRWVLAQIMYALTSGVIVTAGMLAIGLESPWLYGIMAVILAILPAIGPALAAVPALPAAMDMSPWQTVAVAVFGIVLWAVDGMVIAPRILGAMLRLPMFVVLVALLVGAAIMGVWGALIAPPVAVAIQVLLHDRYSPTADRPTR